ncbi:MAG TPA: DUF2183 domain-containing protein [Chitinophagales bacterium]|nr:DUF2183 domain-containing protein [Chitinophagales bacterium]
MNKHDSTNGLPDKLRAWFARLETTADRYTFSFRAKTGLVAPPEIVPYRGYGTAELLHCRGRILQNKNIIAAGNDSIWRNLINSYRRFESDEVPGATVQIRFNGQIFETVSNEEGYFTLHTPLNPPLPATARIWHTAQFNLTHSPAGEVNSIIYADDEILIPNHLAKYGIISDLDDTVIRSNVISKVRMLYLALFKNAYTRLAFRGVPALYWAFRKGSAGAAKNPIFYVSNSPWNMYDMLDEFMDVNHIPKGPILLRDFGHANNPDLAEAFKKHKYNETVKILETYPHLPFILIGDSGEKDADIYMEIARRFEGRILCIYIRAVKDKKRNLRVQQLANTSATVPFLLAKDSIDMAKHAHQLGFISKQSLYRISQSQYNDRSSVVDFWLEDE